MNILINGEIKAVWYGNNWPTVSAVKAAANHPFGSFRMSNPNLPKVAITSVSAIIEARGA